MEARSDGEGMSGALDWALKETPRAARDVWRLGLGDERNAEGGLRSMQEELINSMWLWAESSEGMRKPVSLKEGG